MKLCIDCKYHTIPVLGSWPFKFKGYSMCSHPSLLSKVDGKPISFCSNQREFDSLECGPSAKLFEPKEVK
jgi:hypothetical protein